VGKTLAVVTGAAVGAHLISHVVRTTAKGGEAEKK